MSSTNKSIKKEIFLFQFAFNRIQYANMTTRNFFIHIFTGKFNLSNLALYVTSPNEFREHYGTSDHRLSGGSPAEKAWFVAVLGFVSIQAYCNQKTYSKTIDRVLPNYRAENEAQDEDPSKYYVILSGISSLYKAAVTCSSLLTLTKSQLTLLKGSWNLATGWTLAAVCFPGNACSQFAIFAIPVVRRYHWHLPYWPKLLLSHALALTYNLPNVALYFNLANAFLKNTKLLEHRLTEGHELWEQAVVIFLGFLSIVMFFSTQRTYSKKVAAVFTDPERVSPNGNERTSWTAAALHSVAMSIAGITACYKTAGTSLSLIALVFTFTHSLPLSIAIIPLCLVGNLLAQFSIFKPENTAESESNRFLERNEPKAWYSRLFGNTEKITPEKTRGFSLGDEVPQSPTYRQYWTS